MNHTPIVSIFVFTFLFPLGYLLEKITFSNKYRYSSSKFRSPNRRGLDGSALSARDTGGVPTYQ